MKKFVLALICISFFIIDSSIMPFLSIKGSMGSFLFTFIICYSIINGSWEALGIGVIVGVFQDIYMVKGLGINALTNMILCLIAAKIGEGIFKEKRFIPTIVIILGSVARGVIIFALLYIARQQSDLAGLLWTSVYNGVISIFMYKRVFKLMQKPFMKKEWNF